MKKEKTAKTEKNEKHWERVTQEFAPVCDADCRVLILGTCTYQFWVYIKPLYIENNLPPIPIYKNFMDKCL